MDPKTWNRSVETLVQAVLAGEKGAGQRRAFLGLGEADVARLRALDVSLQGAASRVVSKFYDHLRTFEPTRRLLGDDTALVRMKQKQAQYFAGLTKGDYGADYAVDRLRVGIAHQRIGLDPTWYMGAYCRYLIDLLSEVWEVLGGDVEKVLASYQALIKVVFLDMSLAIDTYIEADRREIVKLKENAEHIIRSMPVGLVVLGKDLRILSANAALEEVFGMPHDDLLGKELQEAVPAPGIRDRAAEVLVTGTPQYDVPVKLAGMRGPRHLEISITTFRGNGGRENKGYEPALLVTLDDLTERDSLRAATADSDARARAVMENVSDAIITVDERGAIESFNPAAERLFGYTVADVLGKDVTMLMPVPHPNERAEYLRRYISDGEPPRLGMGVRELDGLHRDGRTIPLELSVAEMDLGGRRLLIGALRDISARRHSEQEMRLAASVFENSLEGIMITDADAKIVRVNQAFSDITGYSAEEAIGQNPRLLKSDHHNPDFYRSLWASLNEKGMWQGEIWNRRKDGSVYPEWLNISVVRDDRGTAVQYIGVFTDITEQKLSEERLHRLAHYDVLTDLPNRALLNEHLAQALVQARRYRRLVAVLFLDLDRFKLINDTLGHVMGDQLLRGVASRLRKAVRRGDMVARLGGDEFAVVLPEVVEARYVVLVASKILSSLSHPFEVDGQEVYATASVGIALQREEGEDPITLLKDADTAMYRAKQRGGNCFRFFTEDMNTAAKGRLALENSMRRGLERDEFCLHYQPQVDLRNGRAIGVEALLRWKRPSEGLVFPSAFVSVAEETGQIVPIGRWVLEQACADMATWQEAGLAPSRVAVNISARQFQNGTLVEDVRDALESTRLDARFLELELTESLLMERPDRAAEKLHELKRMGVSVAIDDFGIGYSSLDYLRRFPINKIKIDQSFVSDIPVDASACAIADTIIAMARNLDLDVIAEGVENEAQVDFLKANGCPEVQGFYFSKPLGADSCIPVLREGWAT